MTRQEVYGLIDGERVYQERRWPGHVHGPAAYLTYLWHYYRRMEFVDSTLNGGDPDHYARAGSDMRKFAALCVACLQQNGVPMLDRANTVLELPTHITVYQEIDRQCQLSQLCCGFSEYLHLLRLYLGIADRHALSSAGRASQLYSFLDLASIAVRCMEEHGAPRREGV